MFGFWVCKDVPLDFQLSCLLVNNAKIADLQQMGGWCLCGAMDSDDGRGGTNLDDLWRVPVGPLESGLVDQIDELALCVYFPPR